MFLGLICIGIGCFFLTGAWGAYSVYKGAQGYSGRASGHVTNKHFQATADGGGKYYLDYWFVPAGGSKINTSSGISRQQWDALKVNDSLEIRFDPSNPNRNMPLYGGSPSLVYAFFMLMLGTIFILFGGSRFYNSFHKRTSLN
jgi:hypothetical protein